jgi:hypothetical protein
MRETRNAYKILMGGNVLKNGLLGYREGDGRKTLR